jgi:bifunctional non-homologous end joining protein LigD
MDRKLPEIRDAIAALGLTSAALDGELIAGAGTKEDFNLLQATLSGERQSVLTYALFDLLHLDGVDVADAPLLERKPCCNRCWRGRAAHWPSVRMCRGMATGLSPGR